MVGYFDSIFNSLFYSENVQPPMSLTL